MTRVQVLGVMQLVVVAVLAAGGIASCSQPRQLTSATAELASCATSPTVLMNGRWLPTFKQVVLNSFSHLPIHEVHAPATSVSQAQKQFQRGATAGYVTALAYSVPYVSSGAGYTSGGGPLLPLQGPIVVQHPGLLEAYELVSVFSGRTGADWYQQFVERSISAVPDVAHPSLPAPYRSYYAALYTLGSTPSYEHEVRVEAVLGSRVEVDLAFRGGAGMTVAGLMPLVDHAITAIKEACLAQRG